MKKLHLDNEHRDRWIEFHLANGTVEDSRLKNWRHVDWGQVIQLTAHLVGHVHAINCKGPGFRAFMNFRWGGQEARHDCNGKYIGHQPIRVWTIGWTNGESCFLTDIDFHTGLQITNYITPLSQFEGHLHSDVKDMVLA